MKKTYFLLVCLLVLISCDFDETKYHDVRLMVGEPYSLGSRNMDIDLPPDEFIASVNGGDLIGEHVGYTEMEASRGSTTHVYRIWVDSPVNMFNDMSYLLRFRKNEIMNLFGPPKEQDGNLYFFLPLDKFSKEKRNIFEFDYQNIISCSTTFDGVFRLDLMKHLSDRYQLLYHEGGFDVYGDAYYHEHCSVIIEYDYTRNPLIITYMTRASYDRYHP